MKVSFCLLAVVVALLAFSSSSFAQNAESEDSVDVGQTFSTLGEALVEPEKPQNLEIGFSTDFTTAYYFRGILQEDSGLISQTNLSGLYTVTDGVRVYGNWFNSIHSDETNAKTSSEVQAWYETSFKIGLEVDVVDDVTVFGGYNAYISPSSAFDEIQEFQVGVRHKDQWGLNPYVLFAIETEGSRDGSDPGSYAEIGVRPAWVVEESLNLTLAVPVRAGFSLGDYYGTDDADFGFASVGLEAELPLAFLGDDAGSWTLRTGVNAVFLGSDADKFNRGDEVEIIGTVGFGVAF